MGNAKYRINDEFDRVKREKIEQFAEIPVPNIGDAMNRMAALSSNITLVNNKDIRMMGTAYTVNCPAGDNLLLYYAVDNAKPGDVIIVANDGYTERALCGEIMATMATKRKVAGIIIDGAIRDKSIISEMDLPIFAVSNSPNGPYKNGPGEINVPVSVGGKVICPGDIVIGDMDGIIVIRPEEADAVCERAKEVTENEASVLAKIENEGKMDLDWLYEEINSNK